ncbi:N-alpha-acetyltransferase 35, NatC auxiliary subunit [Selaginella moellendorffii]|uniref:N-alpha-acetyltransferase 35, NatC auxiliary subunit n=1 Tax=Selaginella moellendorffii TaxID=88036 RepID=UPI000D1C6C6B|nr:N-alpha-acetyltransferase 35, NatC auxiliary subunit [Selaginella moellendorffii]|eukprot:XP_024537087.1 N-alpha-acetyltransferase 35, NatC auxiliary subunit [Selaginella moellendorffii]
MVANRFLIGASMAAAAGDQTLWADATEIISQVCQELSPGELIHGENFSLFESMSALEIMDPKMDGGMDIGGPKSVEDAIASDLAPTDLSIAQIIDIMDHLLSCEATWHRGHSLAQTVFSSIYMLKLVHASSMPVLHAYCKITRASCNIVRTAVALAHTHEEEDLFVISFGLPIDHDDADCLAVLNGAEEMCVRSLRSASGKKAASDARSSKSASGKKPASGVVPLQENPELEADYCQSVLSRLRFRKAFSQIHVHMNKPQGKGLETARKHIATALTELSLIRESRAFLSSQHASQDPNNLSSTTASGRGVVGFFENINRSLLPPTPPRSMKLLPWSEALDYFVRLLNDLDRVCSVPLDIELEELMQLIVDFQKSHPDLVARARMQRLVIQDNKLFGIRPMNDVIYKAAYSRHEAPRDDVLENSFQQAGWLTLTLLKVLCAHPAWQCRKLGKSLDEWSDLFHQVDVLGMSSEEFKKKCEPFTTWIGCQASWIAKQYLMLGFDLGLYSSDDYCMVYRYLDHVLLTYLHYKLAKEKEKDEEQSEEKKPSSLVAAKKKSKKKKPGKNPDPKIILLHCLSDLCKGYIWMLDGLIKDGKIQQRKMEFTTERERYTQRFELLLKLLVPSPLSFARFKETTRLRQYSASDLYQYACKQFMAVEQCLRNLSISRGETPELSHAQSILEIKQLEQVVSRNKVALQIVDRSQPGETLKVSLQFSQHPAFGVIVVKNS